MSENKKKRKLFDKENFRFGANTPSISDRIVYLSRDNKGNWKVENPLETHSGCQLGCLIFIWIAVLVIGSCSYKVIFPRAEKTRAVMESRQRAEKMSPADRVKAAIDDTPKDEKGLESAYTAAGMSYRDGNTREMLAVVKSFNSGDTDLFVAILDKYPNLVKETYTDRRSGETRTLLIGVCSGFRKTDVVVPALIARGADVNAVSSLGKSALAYAADRENESAIEALVKAGAGKKNIIEKSKPATPPETKSVPETKQPGSAAKVPANAPKTVSEAVAAIPSDLKALAVAYEKRGMVYRAGNTREMLAMVNALARRDSALACAILADFPRLSTETHTDKKSGETRTFLIWAGKNKNATEAFLNMLIKCGADVNAVSSKGESALSYAVSRGNAKFVEILLSAGANPEFKTKRGKTLLDLAGKNSEIRNLLTRKINEKRGNTAD